MAQIITCSKQKYYFLQTYRKGNGPVEETELIETKQFNFDSLIHETTRALYQHRLDLKLLDKTDGKSVDEVYGNIIQSLQTAAEEALGAKTEKRSKNIWWSNEIET